MTLSGWDPLQNPQPRTALPVKPKPSEEVTLNPTGQESQSLSSPGDFILLLDKAGRLAASPGTRFSFYLVF